MGGAFGATVPGSNPPAYTNRVFGTGIRLEQ
jgi:hypothetical protein